MSIRRFRDHVADHNWFSVVIDLIIVVIGVFLGLQANNWNQGRLDRERGFQYRQRLITDLQANEEDFRQRAASYRQVADLGYATLQDIRRSEPGDAAVFLSKAFKAANILPRSTRRETYDEIVSAGATETLGDNATRERIMIYYSVLGMTEKLIATLPPYRDRVRGLMPLEIQRRILIDCPEIDREDQRGRPDIDLNGTCHPTLHSAEAAAAASQLKSAEGIEIDLTRSVIDAESKIAQFNVMQREAGRLRAVLESTS